MANELAKFSHVLKLDANRKLLAGALARDLDLDRFIRRAWIQTQINEDIFELAKRNPTTVFRAMLQCAMMGLYPDGINGDAYLVKFGNQCVAIRGYKGMMKLFAAHPAAAPMPFVVDTIREKDTWAMKLGANPSFEHEPAKDDRGKVTHFYAIARFADGSIMPKVMSVEEVEKYKTYAKTAKFWDAKEENTREWMRKKAVIRQLMKSLPLAETTRADVEREEALESGSLDADEYLSLNGESHISGGEVQKTQGKAIEPAQDPVPIATPPEAEVVDVEASEGDPFMPGYERG